MVINVEVTDGQPATLSLALFFCVPLCFHFPPPYTAISDTSFLQHSFGDRYICSRLFTRELKLNSGTLELRSKN